MSLVSCVMADMQYTMMSSDCEDKAANISAKLKSVTEQGTELGKMLSNFDSDIGDVKSKLRECFSAKNSANYNPDMQQYLPEIDSDIANLQDQLSQMAQEKIIKEADKKSLAAQEKELTAEQTGNDIMKKLSDGLAQKFKGYADGAIKRFTGGGQG